MEKRPFICDGDKYTISATNTIGMPVSLSNLPREIEIEGNKLLAKSSFHVSLVCINEIIKKYKVSITDFRNKVLGEFCDFIKMNPISLLNYLPDFKFVEQDNLKTVVVMCRVINLDKFFEILNKKYNLNIEYPPTHVTLYAHDGMTGIFLTDANDIKNYTKPIPNPIGRPL